MDYRPANRFPGFLRFWVNWLKMAKMIQIAVWEKQFIPNFAFCKEHFYG